MPPLSVPLAAIRQPAFLYDAGGRIAEANDRAEALAGQPLVGRSIAEVGRIFACRHDDGTPFAPAELPASRALEGEEVVDLPVTVALADGRERAIVATASPIREGDAVTGGLVIWQEVTGRKQAEEAISKNLATLKKSQEIGHLGSWTLNFETGLFEASDEDYRIYGLVPGTPTILDEIWGMIHPDDRDRYREYVESVRLEGRSGGIDYRIVWPDGSLHYVHALTDSIVRGQDGRVKIASGITQDITERKRAEEALQHRNEELAATEEELRCQNEELMAIEEELRQSNDELLAAQHRIRESEERLRSVLDNSRDFVYRGNLQTGIYEYVSPSVKEVMGYTPEEFAAMDSGASIAMVHPDDLPLVQEALARLPETGAEEVEYRLQTREGGYRWVSNSVSVLNDSSGRPLYRTGSVRDITVRKRVEEALRLTQASVDGAAEMVAWFRPDGSVHYVNDATCRMLGYSREELLKMNALDFSPGFTTEQYEAHWLEVRARKSFTLQPVHRRKDGSTYTAEVLVNHVVYGGQEFIFAYGRDITGRKLAEEALRESEARYRELFESMVEGFALHEIVLDAAGDPVDYRFLAANPAFEAMTGLSAGDIVGRTALEVLPGLEPGWIERYGRVATTGEPERFLSYSSPLERWYDVHAYSPGPGRFATVFTDVTGERRAEEALRETRDYLDNLITYANAPIIVWDPDLGITRFNAAFEEMSGYAADEVIGRNLVVLFPEESRQESLRKIELTSTGQWQSVEIPILRPDGGVRIALWNSANIYDTEGTTLLATIAQGQDITERIEAEEALREYAENLARSNEDLERFAYVSSHDLQEPLRSIVSFSQLLERRYKGQLDDDADDYINFIVEGGTRMQTLIQDLLAYSRVNTTKQDLRPTDVEDVMAAVERSLDLQLREAGAVITHDPLPVVPADPLQLEQVVVNLVSNAIKFRRDDVPLRIHVGARRMNDFWEFSVTDNGIGIEPEYHDRIFVIFQRLHTKDAYPGTGIGLAIVKRIIDRHGGTIRVESTPGEGSTFSFTLPAADSAARHGFG